MSTPQLMAPKGLQKARGRQYGLIISDWTMEPMSGLEFLKEIRKDSDLQGTPFILVHGRRHVC